VYIVFFVFLHRGSMLRMKLFQFIRKQIYRIDSVQKLLLINIEWHIIFICRWISLFISSITLWPQVTFYQDHTSACFFQMLTSPVFMTNDIETNFALCSVTNLSEQLDRINKIFRIINSNLWMLALSAILKYPEKKSWML
jgi:hypothetical protein